MTAAMKASSACTALIREYEGCKLKAYICPAGIPTIGVGHTAGVRMGDRCTLEQAAIWLADDLKGAESAIARLVRVPLEQCQFDALASFVFNLGARRLAESTLLILLNKGNYSAAADQFKRWAYAGKQVLPGLVKRRAAEAKMFLATTKESP